MLSATTLLIALIHGQYGSLCMSPTQIYWLVCGILTERSQVQVLRPVGKTFANVQHSTPIQQISLKWIVCYLYPTSVGALAAVVDWVSFYCMYGTEFCWKRAWTIFFFFKTYYMRCALFRDWYFSTVQGMFLIGSCRLSWFPSFRSWGTGELVSFWLSREQVQPALDGRLTDSQIATV